MEELLEGHGRGDGAEEERADDPGAPLELHLVGAGLGVLVRNGEAHDGRRHQVVDHRRQEERKELEEAGMALLPDHEGGDVPKGAEGAAGIGRHDDVDAAHAHKARVAAAHRQDHRAHQQRGGQVVGNGRQEEGDDAGNPEELAVAELPAHQPAAQRLEDIALGHGVDVGHGDQQEEEERRVLKEVVVQAVLQQLGVMAALLHQIGDDEPDGAGGKDDRLALAQVDELLRHDHGIGDHENDKRQDAEGVGNGAQMAGGELAGCCRKGRQQEPGKAGKADSGSVGHGGFTFWFGGLGAKAGA